MSLHCAANTNLQQRSGLTMNDEYYKRKVNSNNKILLIYTAAVNAYTMRRCKAMQSFDVLYRNSLAILFLSLLVMFTGASHAATTASLTAPVSGSELSGKSITYEWVSADTTITAWSLWVGSFDEGRDIFNSRIIIDPSVRSIQVDSLPTDGTTVYTRLYGLIEGRWTLMDSTENVTASMKTPELLSPIAGESLSGSSQTFTWTNNDTDVQHWSLWVGSAPGERDIYNEVIYDTQVTLTDLPTDCSLVYVSLYSAQNGIWLLEGEYEFSSGG